MPVRTSNVCELVCERVCEPVCEWLRERVCEPVCEWLRERVCEPVCWCATFSGSKCPEPLPSLLRRSRRTSRSALVGMLTPRHQLYR